MNEALTVKIGNPHALRASLLIALEATWPDLSVEQVSVLKEFTISIPQQVEPTDAHLFGGAQDCLLALHGHFRTTRTCYYLHEQLRVALVELMTPLTKGAPQ